MAIQLQVQRPVLDSVVAENWEPGNEIESLQRPNQELRNRVQQLNQPLPSGNANLDAQNAAIEALQTAAATQAAMQAVIDAQQAQIQNLQNALQNAQNLNGRVQGPENNPIVHHRGIPPRGGVLNCVSDFFSGLVSIIFCVDRRHPHLPYN